MHLDFVLSSSLSCSLNLRSSWCVLLRKALNHDCFSITRCGKGDLVRAEQCFVALTPIILLESSAFKHPSRDMIHLKEPHWEVHLVLSHSDQLQIELPSWDLRRNGDFRNIIMHQSNLRHFYIHGYIQWNWGPSKSAFTCFLFYFVTFHVDKKNIQRFFFCCERHEGCMRNGGKT